MTYLDHNATTGVDPKVLESMLPYWTSRWGNPSSVYRFAREAGRAVEESRAAVAELLRAQPREIIFTSCGTESNNTAIQSALAAYPEKRHVIISSVEHSSVKNLCERLGGHGVEVEVLPVGPGGELRLEDLEQAIRSDTAVVSLIWANKETGVLFPVEAIGEICRRRGVLFHTDAVQAVGKVPIDLAELPIDLLSLSAHKLYAPKGIGALYVRGGTPFVPHLVGGQQEAGRRGGTENVPYIVGLGCACQLVGGRMAADSARVGRLRDRLETGLVEAVPGTSRNGAPEPRVPNTTNLSFAGTDAEALVLAMDQKGICVSTGSACTSGNIEPSHVLVAMGLDNALARSAIRFSLGYGTTEEDIAYALEQIPRLIAKIRDASPGPMPG